MTVLESEVFWLEVFLPRFSQPSGCLSVGGNCFFSTLAPPPGLHATAASNFSKLTKFKTRFRLYASVTKLHSVRTFASPFKLKCVNPIHRLIVPYGCSANCFRSLNFAGCCRIRSAICSIRCSFPSRTMFHACDRRPRPLEVSSRERLFTQPLTGANAANVLRVDNAALAWLSSWSLGGITSHEH